MASEEISVSPPQKSNKPVGAKQKKVDEPKPGSSRDGDMGAAEANSSKRSESQVAREAFESSLQDAFGEKTMKTSTAKKRTKPLRYSSSSSSSSSSEDEKEQLKKTVKKLEKQLARKTKSKESERYKIPRRSHFVQEVPARQTSHWLTWSEHEVVKEQREGSRQVDRNARQAGGDDRQAILAAQKALVNVKGNLMKSACSLNSKAAEEELLPHIKEHLTTLDTVVDELVGVQQALMTTADEWKNKKFNSKFNKPTTVSGGGGDIDLKRTLLDAVNKICAPNEKKSAGSKDDPCFRCNELGHWARNCPN